MLKSLITSLFILLYWASSGAAGHRFPVIVDPGHGGSDGGATRGNLREADIVLSVSRHLTKLLEADSEFEPRLTRHRDMELTLEERAQFAQGLERGLFLSVHVNASANPKAHGVEFYFQNQLPPDEESQFMANRENQMVDVAAIAERAPKSDVLAIISDLARNFRTRQSANLGEDLVLSWQGPIQVRTLPLRQAPFFLITHLEIPSILIELGFISHEREARKLADRNIQMAMAQHLYEGVKKFKERLDNEP